MRRILMAIAIALLLLIVAAGAWWITLDKDVRGFLATMPTDRNVLFWEQDQRDAAFRAMDGLPALIDSRTIKTGDYVRPLPVAAPIAIDVADYMADQRSAALIIVIDGEVVLEEYGLGFGPEGKWTSFSVAKSVTSTLVGAALADGDIESLDDPVAKYIDGLKGSAYEDVSVEQLLTMTSGVRWNEDYSDPNSDVALFLDHEPLEGMDATVSYMRGLPRVAPAGEEWVYKTGETNLIGVLISEATGRHLADYASEKIWIPAGMQQDATWLLGESGSEISGCCIQAATRDMARFGLFILEGATVDGSSIVPDGYITGATTKQADIGSPGRGYGYQWWTYDDGSYAAQGIFGQGIFIDPARNLVIASNSNWPTAAGSGPQGQRRLEFYKRVQDHLDGSAAASEQADAAAAK